MKKSIVGIISLGCPRNMVDSEVMLGILKKDGFAIIDNISHCDVALINTCAFIEDAKQEAIDIILQAVELKKQGKIKFIVVAGCLPQRYSKVLEKQIPEINAFLGTSDFNGISKIIKTVLNKEKISIVSPPNKIYSHITQRFLLTPAYNPYIKIAEGCNNKCSYCAIYKIRGKYRSRPMSSIIYEIKNITKKSAVSELNIIAQDTTSYGKDLYKGSKLDVLLNKICGLKKAHWIRLLYTHPKHFTSSLINVIKNQSSICKYIDLPVQHASDKILTAMNRRISKDKIYALIQRIREEIPSVALRTSVIVGFPGETDKDFKELMGFIEKVKFERLGAFIYSREENTPAYKYKKQVRDSIKKQRLDEIMKTQQNISGRLNKLSLGKTVEVLIDGKSKNGLYVGRTQYDAPEVDGVVYVKAKKALPGEFLNVKITDTLEYDLAGEAL